jgi:riboflavin synthase
MFTGLIETAGLVAAVVSEPPGVRLRVEAAGIAADARLGDSVCVGGCCLSVVRIEGPCLEFELGPETLARTALGAARAGARVNLERSLTLADRLGGHFVTGHVDVTIRFAAAPALLAQMAGKGSVAVDGVSLTVVDVTAAEFGVALIPHTLAATTLGGLSVGDRVNLETDLLAKYVARFLEAGPSGGSAPR